MCSGPSGVGKDSVLDLLFTEGFRPDRLDRCLTATTREPRPTERDGVDYLFFSRAEFEGKVAEGSFLEHAEYAGNLYGTPGERVAASLDSGNDLVLKIEVQGALQVRRSMPEAILVFIGPPSEDELRARLSRRASESPEAMQRRLDAAGVEMAHASEYDYLVINHTIHQAAEQIRAIVLAERCRILRSGV